MSNDLLLWLLLIGAALNLALGLWLLLRRAPVDAQELAHRERLLDQLQQQGQQVGQRVERVESELRREISEQSRGGRQDKIIAEPRRSSARLRHGRSSEAR